MKKIAALLLCLTTTFFLQAQTCGDFNYTLTTQAEVNAFPANCDEIEGSLSILNPDINDLTPLQNITSIGASLSITITSLTNLNGLENLTSIGEGLTIGNNDLLTNLDGLQNLTEIASEDFGILNIDGNDALVNLDGLQNLRDVSNGGEIFIFGNDDLTEFCGLHTLFNEPDNGGADDIRIENNGVMITVGDIENGEPCSRILPPPAENLPAMSIFYLLTLGLITLGVVMIGVRRLAA